MSPSKPNGFHDFFPLAIKFFVLLKERGGWECIVLPQTPKGKLAFSFHPPMAKHFHQILALVPPAHAAAVLAKNIIGCCCVTSCHMAHGHVCEGCRSSARPGGWPIWVWILAAELPNYVALDKSFQPDFLSTVTSFMKWGNITLFRGWL